MIPVRLQSTAQEASYVVQHEVIPTWSEQNHRVVNQLDVVHLKVKRHVRLDVPDFSSEYNMDTLFDWKHCMKAYFKWYDMPEECKLHLTGTAKMVDIL